MTDTFTNNLRVRLPQTGAYNNTWGSVLNADALNLLDSSIAGQRVLVLSALTYSLAALVDGTDSDSRYYCLSFIGSPSDMVTVTMPASVVRKPYLIDNQTLQDITFTYAGSSNTAIVSAGVKQFIWCDGTDCWTPNAAASDSDSLGGIPAAYYARTLQTADEITAVTYTSNIYGNYVTNSSPWFTVTDGSTVQIDCRMGNNQVVTLAGNRTVGIPSNPLDGQTIQFLVIQDGTGSRTLGWPSQFIFENGLSPQLATAAGNVDLFEMVYNAALMKWIVGHFGNISGGSGTTTNYTISENTMDWNLLAKLGSPSTSLTVNIIVGVGTVIQASCTATPAMDLSGLPSGSTVNLTNLGYILGKGGNGGNGSEYARGSNVDAGPLLPANIGRNGGIAISGVGVGVTLNITNGAGFIFGGGGGGGGGGVDTGSGYPVYGNGGGGGGGAGGGMGGDAGYAQNIVGTEAGYGTDGSTGPLGTNGSGGVGESLGYAGGDGGAWGANGVVGLGTVNFGAAGTAGKAIELNGGSAPHFNSGNGSPNILGVVS